MNRRISRSSTRVRLEARAGLDPDELADDLHALFDAILELLPGPTVERDGPAQMQVTTLEHSSYVGKIAVGKLRRGTLRTGQNILRVLPDGTDDPVQDHAGLSLPRSEDASKSTKWTRAPSWPWRASPTSASAIRWPTRWIRNRCRPSPWKSLPCA